MISPHKSDSTYTIAIQIVRLTKRYGSLTAVDNLDLSILRGQIFGLLGPNGAGKSTTIKILTTILKPTSGSASIAGFDVLKERMKIRRRIGYVPQLLSADGGLTARENLTLSAKLYGLSRTEYRSRIDHTLQFMGLEVHSKKLVRSFSGGMIRRLEIAQALLHRPEVLILDEPTIGLDPMARSTVWEKLKALRSELGLTVLLTTHDMEEADELCDELAILHQGRKVISGKPSILKAGIGQDSNLGDVFSYYCGGAIQDSGNYRSVSQTRRTASRLG